MKNVDIDLALMEYDELRHQMKRKQRLGLITDDVYYDFLLKEDTLWNIINK